MKHAYDSIFVKNGTRYKIRNKATGLFLKGAIYADWPCTVEFYFDEFGSAIKIDTLNLYCSDAVDFKGTDDLRNCEVLRVGPNNTMRKSNLKVDSIIDRYEGIAIMKVLKSTV